MGAAALRAPTSCSQVEIWFQLGTEWATTVGFIPLASRTRAFLERQKAMTGTRLAVRIGRDPYPKGRCR